MTYAGRLLLTAGLLLSCAGCVLLPYSGRPDDAIRSPLATEARQFIVVGSTTREDILLRFGQPEGEDQSAFRYWWAEEHGVFGLYSQGGGVLVSRRTDYFLVIEFTEDNKVASYRVVEEPGSLRWFPQRR